LTSLEYVLTANGILDYYNRKDNLCRYDRKGIDRACSNSGGGKEI
jgi:hypothetical protein